MSSNLLRKLRRNRVEELTEQAHYLTLTALRAIEEGNEAAAGRAATASTHCVNMALRLKPKAQPYKGA